MLTILAGSSPTPKTLPSRPGPSGRLPLLALFSLIDKNKQKYWRLWREQARKRDGALAGLWAS